MKGWNKYLKRMMRRKLGDEKVPDKFYPLFNSISDAFDTYEKDYAFLNRIMDLSSEELFEANNKLGKRNEELDRFVYSTCHDMRAPLTSIMGLLELIKLTDNEQDKKKYLEQIHISTHQLDTFIQEIVAFTYNKKIDLKSAPIDFNELVNRCMQRHSYMDYRGEIQKIVDVDMSGPFYSDPQRMDNLLSNLISNALKYYNPEVSSPYLKLTVRSDEEKAAIKIEDNGIGIKEEMQVKIFDMFFRASDTNKGSGIGLYIVREIVDKLSGELRVVSKYKAGTTFDVWIPNLERIQA